MTTASIRIAQFLGYVLGGALERTHLLARERVNKTRPRQARDLGGAALGKPTEFIPLDGGGDAHFPRKFAGGLVQGGKGRFGHVNDQLHHVDLQ